MILMNSMKMPIMFIIDMIVVLDSFMPTIGAMPMLVTLMRFAGFTLSVFTCVRVFHRSRPFMNELRFSILAKLIEIYHSHEKHDHQEIQLSE